jgi:hypothetical protein
MNEQLDCFNKTRFSLELSEGTTLEEIHKLIFGDSPKTFVSIVDGHAQTPDYALEHSCNVSIFRPMGGRTHDPFEKI